MGEKGTSDPIEPEPVRLGWMRRMRGRKKTVAALVTLVMVGGILAEYPPSGYLIFPVLFLWCWALPGRPEDYEAWRARHDTFFEGYNTGMTYGGSSAMGAGTRSADDRSRREA
jgi:hypothetical protein